MIITIISMILTHMKKGRLGRKDYVRLNLLILSRSRGEKRSRPSTSNGVFIDFESRRKRYGR